VALAPGARIGIYEITAPIGEGGMGTVYRARDTQLSRDVALKVLPDSFSNDPDRVARFTREAQVLAALDHPSIAKIYGLERFGTNQIIVMEMVEGATLEARLAHGPLAIDEARHLGIQIADALDAAHERGIVHRDLKPSNVVIRPDGNVRVLDFGLAKTLPATSLGGASMSPTVTSGPATSAGVILGTAPYMSPEQSRGLAVDRRTDIWALGCLLYECLAGRRAFEGSTLSDTLAQILTTDPDWSKLPATTPTAMSALIRRCVRKDLRQRMQSAGDVRLALEDDDGNAITPGVRTFSRVAWLVLAAAAVVFAGGLALFLSTPSASRQLVPPTAVRADVVFPDQAPLWFEEGNSLAMSRDGRTIAWVGGTGSARRLWVRSVDQIEARALAGTEEALSPFFSPNGEWLGFFTPTALKKTRIAGGSPQTLVPVAGRPRGAAWGEDDSIVFSSFGAPLRYLPPGADGPATIAQIPALAAQPGRLPVWLPGRRVILYETNASSVRGRTIAAFDLASGGEKTVIEDAAQPAVLPNGNLLFLRGDALHSVAFDADTLSPRGEPRMVVPSVQSGASTLIGQYATGGGRLLYLPGQNTAAKPLIVVEYRGITGGPRLLISDPGTYRDFRFSPDGQRLAYSAWPTVDADMTDLFVYDLQRDVKVRLAGDPAFAEWRPVWTSEGRFVVFSNYSPKNPSNGIHRIRADGSGQPEQLTTATTPGAMQVPVSISPDGKYLAYQEQEINQPADIWILPMNPAGAPFRFFTSPVSDTLPVFSPDGRWIAYASDESGTNELYIRPFPNADAKWQVSSSGTLDEHAWSRDGSKLFFRAGDGQSLMAATISTAGGSLAIGRATGIVALQAENYPELGFWGGLALSPDDRGFALAKYASEVGGTRNRVVLMLDWIDAMPPTAPGSRPR
jgi:eukaryotic-like serine/threonine-protein kinase